MSLVGEQVVASWSLIAAECPGRGDCPRALRVRALVFLWIHPSKGFLLSVDGDSSALSPAVPTVPRCARGPSVPRSLLHVGLMKRVPGCSYPGGWAPRQARSCPLSRLSPALLQRPGTHAAVLAGETQGPAGSQPRVHAGAWPSHLHFLWSACARESAWWPGQAGAQRRRGPHAGACANPPLAVPPLSSRPGCRDPSGKSSLVPQGAGEGLQGWRPFLSPSLPDRSLGKLGPFQLLGSPGQENCRSRTVWVTQ